MSIPLVQNNEKDSINTSIIAIKRNIERINMLLGLVDSGSPDLSGLATKQELEDAVTELQPVDEVTVGNMHSVSSNAVAECLSYSTEEIDTGAVWIDGSKIYKKTYALINATFANNTVVTIGTISGFIPTDVVNSESMLIGTVNNVKRSINTYYFPTYITGNEIKGYQNFASASVIGNAYYTAYYIK